MDTPQKRVVLVTGAIGGLGTAMCKKLYHDGYNVVANYRSEEKAKKWQEQLHKEEYDIKIYYADVADFNSCGEMIEKIAKEVGHVDVLVNNAGITKDGAFRKMTYENWKAVMSTNLDSVFNCSRHVINHMIDNGWGRIINISSVNGQRGQFGQANYSAAKAGMHGFTKTLAMEVANKGVTVNTISPGYIGTDMVMAVKEEIRNQIISQIPMGRLGGTEEVAYLVSFLASDHANFITGANMSINGGQHVY
ncbi:MAG: acetoacetyl-CoA reductase [Bacteroidota bacterium]